MAEKTIYQNTPKVITLDTHCAIIDGDVVHDIPTRLVFVQSESELANFTDKEPAGTMAAKYGFANMWQLKPDKTWESLW